MSWCEPSFDPSNINRIFIQKGLNKNNNIDFSYYEKKTFCKNVSDAFIFYLM